MLCNFRAAVDDWDEVCSALGAWEATHSTSNDIATLGLSHFISDEVRVAGRSALGKRTVGIGNRS